jgi:hypothetical protein
VPEESVQNIINRIKELFPHSNVCPGEFRIDGKYWLRFELGDGKENGTLERVNQSTECAYTLFSSLFSKEDDLVVVSNDIKYVGDVMEFWPETEYYFEEQLNESYQTNFLVTEKYIEDFSEALNEETDEMVHIPETSNT